MDLRKLKSLIDLVSDSEISELEISEGEDRVKIVRSNKKEVSYKSKYKENLSHQSSNEEENILLNDNKIIGNNKNIGEIDGELITSPMVGTFYRSPSPNAEPFVNIDDEIIENQTLCVIEAMKLMNEIPSNLSGFIAEIFVENGQPVEFGQPLFRLIKK
jgi:acetyl-CoA carboxylase biotin carboxyl carrier protein